MKRIKVASRKFVTISDELAEKAERVMSLSDTTKAAIRAVVDRGVRSDAGPMLGSRRGHRRKLKR
jgi:hypothetical protein